jgi:hypothetical protein
MNIPYETAMRWIDAGFPVLPIAFMSKKAMVDWKEFQTRLPSYTELSQWFYSSIMNLGLIVGNGLVVIDFDIMAVFEHWVKGFEAQFPQGTYMVETRRGIHVYVHTELPAKNYHNPMLDIKAERGYVLIPPSVHPSGFEYRVWQDKPILRVKQLTDVLGEEYMPAVECVERVARPQYVQSNDPWEDAFTTSDTRSVQEIRARVSILDLIEAESSDRSGRWYVAKCPFHSDENESFWIDLQKQMCGCFKGCNAVPMDVINLYSKLNHLSNEDAIRELSKR